MLWFVSNKGYNAKDKQSDIADVKIIFDKIILRARDMFFFILRAVYMLLAVLEPNADIVAKLLMIPNK